MTSQKAKKNKSAPGKSQGAQPKTATTVRTAKPAEKPSKLSRLVERLKCTEGATIADLTALTGWQAHSVRGALAGTLKRKGHKITSEKVDGVHRYRIGAA